jgi:anaerobic selenocysteine-containing dehydrogenase
LWIFQELAKRLGFGEEMAGTPRQWLGRILTPMQSHGVSIDTLMKGPIRCPIAPMVPFADRKFPTKSGRFEFVDKLEVIPHFDSDYPLTFVTNFSKKWLLSQMLESEHPKVASVRVGEATAKQFGIEDGKVALLSSRVGKLEVEVAVDPRVGEGMVIMPVGTWMKRGGGANVLTEAVMSNFGEMAAYGETRVRIDPIRDIVSEGGVSPETLDSQMTL